MGLLDPVYRLFEGWIDPFKPRADYQPPNRLAAFVWHYVGQTRWAFASMLLYGFLNAIVEASLFTFVGKLVDVMGAVDAQGLRGTGWAGLMEHHGWQLLTMFAIVA